MIPVVHACRIFILYIIILHLLFCLLGMHCLCVIYFPILDLLFVLIVLPAACVVSPLSSMRACLLHAVGLFALFPPPPAAAAAAAAGAVVPVRLCAPSSACFSCPSVQQQ